MLPRQVDFWAAYLFMTKPVTRFLELNVGTIHQTAIAYFILITTIMIIIIIIFNNSKAHFYTGI